MMYSYLPSIILLFLQADDATSFSTLLRHSVTQHIDASRGTSSLMASRRPSSVKQNDTLVLIDNDDTINDDHTTAAFPPSTLPWNNTLATQQINDLNALTSSSTMDVSSKAATNIKSLPDINAAVIVPGFLTGQDEFTSLANSLTNMGIPTVVVPMSNWHWLPTFGGRSMRPILDKIDHTVRHLAAVSGNLNDYYRVTKEHGLENLSSSSHHMKQIQHKDVQLHIPNFKYTSVDCMEDFFNNPIDEKSVCYPRGSFPAANEPTGRVALIGHSAGGWISRLYLNLSGRRYGGKVYDGHKLVHSLVTLGSPHLEGAFSQAFKPVKWANSEIIDSSRKNGVRHLAVGGKGYKGISSGLLTQSSYAFCCPNRSNGSHYDGDGITPLESALAMKEYVRHADTLVFDDVTHFNWDHDLIAPGK